MFFTPIYSNYKSSVKKIINFINKSKVLVKKNIDVAAILGDGQIRSISCFISFFQIQKTTFIKNLRKFYLNPPSL